MNRYTHGRTCVYNINYHIVWCVKYRRKVLSQKISERLYELCHEIAKAKGFTIVNIKAGENDHVHCFVSAPPKISITQIVKYLKADFWKNFLNSVNLCGKGISGTAVTLLRLLALHPRITSDATSKGRRTFSYEQSIRLQAVSYSRPENLICKNVRLLPQDLESHAR